MINYSNLQIDKLAIHRVGNQQRQEKNFISESLFQLNEEMESVLTKYFLKPIKKSEDHYRFQHSTDLSYNEVYNYAKKVFDDNSTLHEQSANIVQHLYNQSTHPNIKSGEVYVAYFKDIVIDDEVVDGIGVFKSERKSTFLKVSNSGNNLMIDQLEGIHIEKLDKGCLILNTESADGFRVLSVDNNNYDALYWTHHFLNIDFVADENFHTKLYLEMCNEFSSDVVAEKTDRREQVQFLADSIDYFTKNEKFNFEDFTDQVMGQNEEYTKEFKEYQSDFGLDTINNFEISDTALKTAKKKVKNLIKLDTNIQIKLDFNDPDVSKHFIEKGYDEARGMHFYKVYFNEEES
ncbi:MAG: hypothetical protein ACI9XO_003687 [Paraglaciecola sp.]|jgi:hypothetical protein